VTLGSMTNNSNSAVVIGASVAGLLAACALADHFERVLILERELLPPPGQGRKAVPQGRHVHALLPGGLAAIEQLLPGFQAELVAGGGVRCDSMKEIRFVASGHEITRGAASATNILASRPYIEGHLRRRVLELPNITLVDGTSVHGLQPDPDGTRIAGVRLSDDILTCDLVVVATGRGGQLPVWLDALGFPAPAEEKLTVDIRYASRHFTIPDGYLGRDKLILVGAEPGRPRRMGLFAQEDGTWLLTLVGYGPAHKPPTDDAGYLEFLASVAPADVIAAVAAGQALDDARRSPTCRAASGRSNSKASLSSAALTGSTNWSGYRCASASHRLGTAIAAFLKTAAGEHGWMAGTDGHTDP
jgi:hypothetical protein